MRSTSHIARWAEVFVLLLPLLLCTPTAWAHPMGNFSVNHYAKIKVGQRSVEILYLVDMAEIPTYQEIRQFDITPKPNHPTASRYLDRQERLLKEGLDLESDGRAIHLDTISRQIAFAEGAGGLPTMKIGFVFLGKLALPAGAHKLSYADNNFPGRAGWKEIVTQGEGAAILDSSASNFDRSDELTHYASDLLNSPPQQLSAMVNFRTSLSQPGSQNLDAGAGVPLRQTSVHARKARHPGLLAKGQPMTTSPFRSPSLPPSLPTAILASNPGASLQLQMDIRHTPRSRFTQLVSTQGGLTFWVLLSAALIAAGLGALHALEPGHGKTIVAAYLVGSRGTAQHAVLLGVVVTAAHTAGVYLLGAVTLYASRYIVPGQLYPWLGSISGLSVSGLGVFMFLKHVTGESGDHSHAPGQPHSHWFLSRLSQGAFRQPTNSKSIPGNSDPGETRGVSLRELFVLGLTGGIVPCPAALVVLLSAFSLHRIGFGLFLITAFSFGLAAVLVVIGLTMVYAKRFMSSRLGRGGAVLRYLPLMSAAFMVVLGLGIAASALASAPIGQAFLLKDKLVAFGTVILLGLFLGMRHSTDPDHVVAVSTIVSRQGSIRSSAVVGLLWGLGHTLTIFLVGSAIVVFGVVIPPRLGLSMEFCVALMLILLGTLNLTGILRWLTERLTPAQARMEKVTGSIRSAQIERFLDKTVGTLGLYQTLRPLVVGLVHGLAGSAAIALLVLSTIKSPFWSTAYLLVFGFGTMAGMMLMTAAISLPLVFTGKKFFKINHHLTAISGLASMAFGIFLVYHIGFVDGLFTSQVHWVPQ
jgi:nickel/cobalt exporter